MQVSQGEQGFCHRKEHCYAWGTLSMPWHTCTNSELSGCEKPTAKELQALDLPAPCISTRDAAGTNTKASLPGAPHGFSWSEPPRGRRPGHGAPWCCSAPRPQGRFGYSPAWSGKPLRNTAGNPWWRSCRSASSPAPPRCPALGAQDRQNVQASPALVHPTHACDVRFWISLKMPKKVGGVYNYLFTTGIK